MDREQICRELFSLSDTDKDGVIWRRDLEAVCKELDLGFTADSVIPNNHRGRVSFLQFQNYFSKIPDSILFNETSTYESLSRKEEIRPEKFLYSEVPEFSTKEEYEERIVELHSVIAELSRKMTARTDDVIREEEEDNQSFTTDSFQDEGVGQGDAEWDDYTSLAFERDLEKNSKSYRKSSIDKLEAEKQELEKEKTEMVEKFRQMDSQMRIILQERDAYKRQVSDLKATCEYQEARMEAKGRPESRGGGEVEPRRRSETDGRQSAAPWERRSLRRRRDKSRKGSDEQGATPTATSPFPSTASPTSPTFPGTAAAVSSPLPPNFATAAAEFDLTSRCLEFELEIEKINSHVEHLKSQNKVLSLALEESRSTCDSLTELLGKYESNNTALQLSLSYCDSMIESYDVLVALLETCTPPLHPPSSTFLFHEHSAPTTRKWPPFCFLSINRKKAETVARHLLSRVAGSTAHENCGKSSSNCSGTTGSSSLLRPDSGCAVTSRSGGGKGLLDSTWEESSGYTTSSCSTTSSGHNLDHNLRTMDSSSADSHHNNLEETRIKEYISQLKVGRAGVQATVLELESIHSLPHHTTTSTNNKDDTTTNSREGGARDREEEMEIAVLLQEICAIREEKADIRAQLYLTKREKEGLELELEKERETQNILKSKFETQLENYQFAGVYTDEREASLQTKISSLYKTLDRVSRNSDLRQQQALNLIEDLKKANSVLTQALEQSKKRYQSKLRRIEQKLMSSAHPYEYSAHPNDHSAHPNGLPAHPNAHAAYNLPHTENQKSPPVYSQPHTANKRSGNLHYHRSKSVNDTMPPAYQKPLSATNSLNLPVSNK